MVLVPPLAKWDVTVVSLSESLLKLFVGWQMQRQPTAAPPQSHEDYVAWQFGSTKPLIDKGCPDLDLQGLRVLEIGCGTGGRSAYFASLGAAEVVGIDINAEEIAIAKQLVPKLHPQHASRTSFFVSREDEALDIGEFDVVFLIDALEHVVSPAAMFRLAHQYLKRGGEFISTCIGYYHHHGSHWSTVPFATLLFSDETILNVIRWQVSHPSYRPTRFDSDPPIERWRGLYDLRDRPGEYLNKMTLATVKKLCRHSIFERTRYTVVGFSGDSPLVRGLNLLTHLPLLQEVVHSLVVIRATK